MGTTDFGALVAARKKLWEETAWIQGRDGQFWQQTGMIGRGVDDDTHPIHLVDELSKTSRGDQCVMQLVAELQGDGIAGDGDINGREEPMVNDEQTIITDLFTNAVKNKGRMAEQRTVLRFRSMAKNKLAFWLSDKLDEMFFLTASGRAYTLKLDGSTRGASDLPSLKFAASVSAPSSNRVVFQGTATAENNLVAGDTMTWKFLVKVGAYARWKRLKSMRMNGMECYGVVMTPQQARDLKTDSDYMTNVGRAAPRGDSNPLFKGAFAVVDGLYLFEHPKVFNTTGLASGSKWGVSGTVEGAQAILIGAQGLGFARIGDAMWDEADQNNYGHAPGISYGRMVGLLKPQFRSIYDSNTSQDFGLLQLKTAAAL